MNRKCFTLIKKEDKQARTKKQNRLFNTMIYLCLSHGPRHLYYEAEAHNFSWELLEFLLFGATIKQRNKRKKTCIRRQTSSFPILFLIEV